MSKFNENYKNKFIKKKLEPLSVTILPQINIVDEKQLSISLPTITNIQPMLSFSITPVEKPSSEPSLEPSSEPSSKPSSEPLSIEDFMKIMKTSQEKLRIEREKDLLKRKEEREKDLIEFRNKLGLPPELKPKL